MEPAFLQASSNYQQASLDLSSAQSLLDSTTRENDDNDNEGDGTAKEEINALNLLVNAKAEAFNNAQDELSAIEAEYQPLKDEFDAILPVFFDIRDNLKILKKMTPKEVDAHLNPPISKEQLIAETEQHKQLLLAEANNAIAPLQDAVDLEIATDEEMAQLTAWKKYRVLLNRVDTSTAPNIEWPEKPSARWFT
ncbi:tail fiber assembly protein [Providencia sp. CRE-138-0111]|uniref:Tail fiber assembly protein n=1 Tax=Providencia huashanensis TaxID=3037798 RepID=A0ABT9ALR1_9GAMM|nr:MULTISPECIES: tail fiber assembly protein [unclassified Providencia]MDO7829449.1 tail fiber assembly protein [Providencia sp. CRE-138-0026]MDO7855526.1 tail fiber assembly protein [Providencia sp. CRE-138-0111]